MPNNTVDIKTLGLGPVIKPRTEQTANVRLQDFPNSYDKNYRPEYVQEFNRAANQTGLGQIGYGLLSRTLSLIPKVGQGLGAMYGAFSSIGQEDISNIWDNPISNYMNSLDENIKNTFPVYNSLKYSSSGLLGKMGTTSFWANDAFDGIAYAASAFVPGTAIGKGLSLAGKGLQATRVGSRILSGLAEIGATEHRANLLLSTAYNTISEAAVEAYQTQQEIQAIYEAKGYDPVEAKRKASEAAARTFRANTAVLAVPNLVQNMLFHGSWKDTQKAVRSALWNNGDDGLKAAKKAADIDSAWNKLGTGIISEGFWEENVQTSIQQYERALAKGETDLNYIDGIASNMANNVGGLFRSFYTDTNPEETEGAVSIFLGGLIGGATGILSYKREKSNADKIITSEKSRYDDIFGDIGNAALQVMRDNVNSIHKKTGNKKTIKINNKDVEIDEYEFDSNNSPVLDDQAILNLTLNQLRDKQLWDAQTLAAYRNDPALAEINKQVALASYVYGLMNSKHQYSSEEVGILLDKIAKTGSENAKAFEVETEIQSNIEKAKQYARQLEDIQTKEISSKNLANDPLEDRFKQFVIRTQFYLQARKNALTNLSTTASTLEAKNTIDNLIKDTDGYLSEFSNRKKLKEEYKSSIFDRQQLIADYNNLYQKKNKTAEEATKLRNIWYKLQEDSYINGDRKLSETSSTLSPTLNNVGMSRMGIGSREAYNRQLGKTELSLRKVEEALQDPNFDLPSVLNTFLNGVTVIDEANKDRVSNIKSILEDRLGELSFDLVEGQSARAIISAATSGLQDSQNIEEDQESYALDVLLNSVENISGYSLTDKQNINDIMQDPNVISLLELLKANNIEIDENTIFDEEFIKNNQLALSNLSSSNKEASTKATEAIDSLKTAQERLDNINLVSDKNTLKLTELKASDNKEAWLAKDFFVSIVEEPVEFYINSFDPEVTDDDQEYSLYENMLMDAVAGLQDRYPTLQSRASKYLDFLQSTIYPAILANSNKRAEHHRIVNNRIGNVLLDELKINSDVLEILGKDKLKEFIDKVIKDEDVVSIDAILELIEYLKKNASEAQLKSIIDVIYKNRNTRVNEFLDKHITNNKVKTSLSKNNAFAERPYSNIAFLIDNYYDVDELPSYILKFLSDSDSNSLLLAARNLPADEKIFLNDLVNIFNSINSVNLLTNLLSNANFPTKSLIQLKERFKVTPSLEQNIILTQLVDFIYSDKSTNNMNNWILVRGIGGSGKTFLIANTLIDVINNLAAKPTNIYAFSKEKLTSDNINSAIFGSPNNNSFENFMAMSENEVAKLDYIIIDEIFTLTNAEIANINLKLGKVKENEKKLVKVIALGDPSQLSEELEPNVLSAIEINNTLPLTTSYRTSVNSIAAVNKKFQLNSSEVKSISVVASGTTEDLLTNPSSVNGVISTDTETVIAALQIPSTRSRVLIVNDQATVDSYKNQFKGVDVKTPKQAQGYQWDEVYSIAIPQDEDNFLRNKEYYTVFSRSKSLLVVANAPFLVNSNPNRDLSTSIEVSTNDLVTARDMFNTNLSLAKVASEILDGVKVFTKDEVLNIESNQDSLLGKADPEIVSPASYAIEEEPEVVKSGEINQEELDKSAAINYPTNYGLTGIRNPLTGQLEAKLDRGATAHIIRTSDSNPKYYLVAENKFKPGDYFTLAVLGDEDFNGKYGQLFINAITSDKPGIDEVFLANNQDFTLPNIEAISLGSVKITDFNKFRTIYRDPFSTTPAAPMPGAKNSIEDAVIRFYTSYYGNTESGKVLTQTPIYKDRWVTFDNETGEYSVNWKAIGNNIEVVIFDKSKDMSSKYVPKNFSIQYGIPYLVIKNPTFSTKDGVKSSNRNILIRMEPTRLNKNSGYVTSLKIFLSSAKVIEELTGLVLGSEDFGDMIRSYAVDNFEVSSDKSLTLKNDFVRASELFNVDSQELDEALVSIVQSVFSAGESIKYFSSEQEALEYAETNGVKQESGFFHLKGHLIVGATEKSGKWVLQSSRNSQDPESDVEVYREWGVEEGSGPAQLAFNNIAKANNIAAGIQIRMTQTKFGRKSGAAEFRFMRAPSLLTYYNEDGNPRVFTDYDSLYQDPEVVRLLGDQSHSTTGRTYSDLLSMLDKAIQKDINVNQSQRDIAKKIVDAYTTVPVTTKFLESIIGDESFDDGGQHYTPYGSLRTPLRMSNVNDLGSRLSSETDRETLARKLTHSFEGFEKTFIKFTPISSTEQKKPSPSKKVTRSVGELLDKIKPTNIPVLDDIVALVKKFPIREEKVYVLPNGVPNTTIENGVEVTKYHKNVAAAGYVDGVWGIFSDTPFDSLDVDRHKLKIFLHESIHLATKRALHKGLSDLKGKRKDTREAVFYKQISTLKKRFDSAVKSRINPATGQKYKLNEVYQSTISNLDVEEFVANLAHAPFVELAKQITVTPKGTRKSILRQLVEDIIDFFKGLIGADTSVYDSMIVVLENFFSLSENVSPEIQLVTPSISITADELLNKIRKALQVEDEYQFEANLEYIKDNYGHIVDKATLPRNINDIIEIKFSKSFNNLDAAEKASILSSIADHNELSFAYYNTPSDSSFTSPGALMSTRGLSTSIDKLIPELSKESRNIIKTIVYKHIADPKLNILERIKESLVNDSHLVELLYSDLFSEYDKTTFRISTSSLSDQEAIVKFINTPEFQTIKNAVEVLSSIEAELQTIVSSIEDNSSVRYRIAKDFILNKISDNLKLDFSSSEIIKSREELISDLEKQINSPRLLLSGGITLAESSKKLNEYYLELESLKAKPYLNSKDTVRYNELYYTIIPNLENERVALSALKETNSRTGNKIFKDIVLDIYPKFDFSSDNTKRIAVELQELADYDHISKDRLDYEMAEAANISEYMEDYSTSVELTLSDSMKESMSHVYVGNKRISSGLAFIKTMQLATSLDWTFPVNHEKGIIQQLRNLRNNNNSNLDLAIIDNLFKIASYSVSYNFADAVSLPQSIGIATTVSQLGVVSYIAYQINDSNINGRLSYEEAIHLAKSGKVSVSRPTTKAIDLYNWLQSKTNISVPIFNRIFTKAEYLNTLAGVMNTMASMKETELFVASRTIKGNRYKFTRALASGITYSIKDQLRYHLTSLHENDKLLDFPRYFKNKVVNGKTLVALSNGNPAEKELFVRQFFSEIGLREFAQTASINNITDIVNDINGFLERISALAPYLDSSISSEEIGDDVVNNTELFELSEWLESYVDGYLSRFSDLLSKSSDFVRNPSVKDSKGNRFYKFHESTWAYDTLNNLININKDNPVFQGSTGTSKTRRVPDFLLTSFYDHNPFVRGKIFNRIYSVGEYESAKNEDNGSITPYIRENKFFFFHRKFVQGFLDGLRQDKNKYYQFSYIPGDKTKYPLVRIGLLSDASTNDKESPIELAVQQALLQILEKLKYADNINIVNYKESVEKDLFRNFKVGKRAIDELKLDFNEANVPAIAKKVMLLLEEDAKSLLKELLSEEIKLNFDGRTYNILAQVKDKLNPKFSINQDLLVKDAKFRNRNNGEYAVQLDEILPLFDLFYKNNYVNGYFLNQIINGDYSAYKKNSADIIKRNAGVFGPGIKPLVDPEIGSKDKYKVLVLADTKESKEGIESRIKELLFGTEELSDSQQEELNKLMAFFDDFESTDAQGFMLPHRARDLSRGFERAWSIGQVHKPMHFEVVPYHIKNSEGNVVYSTGIPTYLKYSSVVLSDDIVSKFPSLAKLRSQAEKLGVDEIIFNSGVKEGMVKVKNSAGELNNGSGSSITFRELLSLEEDQISEIRDKWQAPPILELSNNNYRFQFNASASANKEVSLFTQLIYFLNVYGDKLESGQYSTTQEGAKDVYSLLAELIKGGREDFEDAINNGGLKSFLLKSLTGPGSERALDMLHNGISVNHPLIEKKAIIALASGLEKATVKIKFPGGKLVLQTSEGIDLYQDPTLYSNLDKDRARELKYYKDKVSFTGLDGKSGTKEMLVAEVIVPQEILTKEQLEALKEERSVFLLPDALGFRIPSTELHSAVALKVKGVYSNKLSNVIIAPKDLVPIHGSDFDVDALFVVTRELYSSKDILALNPDFVSSYFNAIRQALDAIHQEEINAGVENIDSIKSLKRDIKKLIGLLNITETDEEVDQAEVESKFDEYVSTPQLIKNSDVHKIVRKDLPNYNEDRARKEWGKFNGYIYSNGEWILSSSVVGRATLLRSSILSFIENNDKIQGLAGALTSAYSDISEALDKDSMLLLGEVNTPVGYKLVDVDGEGKYVIDPDFLSNINSNIAKLENLKLSIQEELKPIFLRDINNSIKALKSVKQKYIKNRITDAMLEIITDPANNKRMLTPISFKSILQSIDNIPESLVPSEDFDLSSATDEFEAFSLLASGVILTGAFANASKSFGYFARAGANPEIQEIYNNIGELSRVKNLLSNEIEVEDFDSIVQESLAFINKYSNFSVPEGTKLETIESLMGAINKIKNNQFKSLFRSIDTAPKLNSRYSFNLVLNSKKYLFDSLRNVDVLGNYSVTEVYDALTNAAIDNLKLGYLNKARINTNTGSVVIGLVSLGVPINVIVKLLYQPIFKSLVSGKVNNISKWLDQLVKANAKALAEQESSSLSDADLDMVLNDYKHTQGLSIEQIIKDYPEIAAIQLKVLNIFSKGYKVGEDMRNTSNFLNILRQFDVFIEDILQVNDNLSNQIGSVITSDQEDFILKPRNDFSFVVPNLFESAPHVKEAYKTLLSLSDLIKSNITIHSDKYNEFSEKVNSIIPVFSTDENVQSVLANIRRGFSAYLLSAVPIVQERLSMVKPKIVTLRGSKNKIAIGVPRTFSDEVANKLWKIKSYAAANNHDNKFLKLVSISNNDLGISTIGFQSGVNINSEDIQDITLGFRNLNRYDVDENGLVKEVVIPHPQYISKFQEDLMAYAILNYGLQFSSSNFSNYIMPRLLKPVHEQYEELLKLLPDSNTNQYSSLVNHFALSYTLQNSKALPYIPFEFINPYYTEGSKRIEQGFQTIEEAVDGVKSTKKIFYDLRVHNTSPVDGSKLRNNVDYIRRDYNARTEVYKKVYQTESNTYFQRVAKLSDVFYTPVESDFYRIEDYYDPFKATIQFHYQADNSVFTFSKLTDVVNKGDQIYIVPNYNYDRTKRQLVTITSITKVVGGKVPGYKISYVPVETSSQTDTETVVENETLNERPKPKAKKSNGVSFSNIEYNNSRIITKGTKKDLVTGKYSFNGKTYQSVTQDVIPSMETRPFTITDTIGNRRADEVWGLADPSVTKETDMSRQPVDKATYAKLVDRSYNLGIAKGNIFHKRIHLYFSGDPNIESEIDSIMLEHGIQPYEFEWLNDKSIKAIVKRTGTNYFNTDKSLATDKIITEATIISDILGWGGTADLIIDHGNNLYSIFDAKTGRSFNRIFENSFFKYGRTSTKDLFVTPRNKAKLQVVLYALMAKINDPKARFRSLELLYIKDRWSINESDPFRTIDVKPFLEVIEGTLKNEFPEKYNALKQLAHFNQLFDPKTYQTVESDPLHPAQDAAMELQLKILELQSLIMLDNKVVSNTLGTDRDSRDRRKKIEELMTRIMELKGNPNVSYAALDSDIGWMDRWLGSSSASTNPYVQLYYNILTNQKQKARNSYETWRRKFDAIIRKLEKEKGLTPTSSVIGGVNREKLFSFAFKQVSEQEGSRLVLYTESDPEWKNFSEAEKQFLTFVNDSYEMFFNNEKSDYVDPRTNKKVALANKVITYRKRGGKDVPITNLMLYNKEFDNTFQGQKREKFRYTRGFFAKHPPQLTDIQNKHGLLSRQMLRFVKNMYTTNYFEATYDGWFSTDEAIPMKYLGGNFIEYEKNYTMNLELATDAFVKQHYYKLHLDEVYSYGQAMKIYLEAKENVDQGITFDRLKNWFEDSVNLHVLGHRQKEIQLSNRSFGRITQKNFEQFNWAKFLRSLKNFFSGPTMWLKPLTGLPNFVFASLVTLKEGLRNSLSTNFGVAPNSHANFGLTDIAYGFKEAFKMLMWDGVKEDSFRSNKAYLLMEKFGYLPDSYDWYTRPNQLLTARNKLFTSRTMMMFHSIPEEIISTAIFIAQLRAMESTDANGNKSNVWDSYDVKTQTLSDGTEYHTIEWVGGVRGKRNISTIDNAPIYQDVTGLEPEEIAAIKFLYEKMHGGYRIDERVAAEYYIWGELMLQLKKYLPSILKNVWASRGVRYTQGSFIKTIDENGNEVLKWNPNVIEGRWRMIAGLLLNFLSINTNNDGVKGNKFFEFFGLQFDSSYKWSELSDTQKDDLRDFLLTTSMWIALLIGYNHLWDRDDEDTFKKIYGRVTNDFAGYVNPQEVLKNIVNLYKPIALDKTYKLTTSSAELFWSILLYEAGYDDNALTKQGNLRGWSEFSRNVHFLSSYHDLMKGIRESEDLSQIFDERLK